MGLLRRFLANHVLANLTFVLILVLGALAYMDMPRARDPNINFNWISITTVLPGASSIEVEKRITDPIEDVISRKVKNIRFVSSTSRDGVSNISLRFNEISSKEFEKRTADLRREVQSVANGQLPDQASDPYIVEITSSSGFPTAMVALTAESIDENFRRYAVLLQKELERMPGVDTALMQGIEDPELHIAFYPDRLEAVGVTPAALSATIRGYFNDSSVGDIEMDEGRWMLRLEGTSGSLDELAKFPIVGASGIVPLGKLADIYRTTGEPSFYARFQQQPAVLLSVTKQDDGNTLDIIADINSYIEERNKEIADDGFKLVLVDDQTITTRDAIGRMQQNAAIGLALVVLVTFLFLGGKISLLTSIGIPFTLAATFLILNIAGMGLNNAVLLGVVIALGMLVDDAVVVVETIYYRMQRGANGMDAAIGALREVASPVLTSVLTTIAVFLPLMLLPGIVGQFMRVIPLVVCTALILSLIEAFWMLPAHVAALKKDNSPESKTQRRRRLATRYIRHRYSLLLISVMRRPLLAFAGIAALGTLAITLLASGALKTNFFAADPFPLFYVNAELPAGATLQQSLETALALEEKALEVLSPDEVRASIAYSGQMLTETEPLFGDNFAQVFVSLNPTLQGGRSIYPIIAEVEKAVGTTLGAANVSVFVLKDGPPIGQSISMKIRGDDFADIQAVVDKARAEMERSGLFSNINIDFKAGTPELLMSLNGDAIQRAGLSPDVVTSSLQSFVDGSLLSRYQQRGEEVDIRLVNRQPSPSIPSLLQQTLATPDGGNIALGDLLNVQYGKGYQNIRHYDFLRNITISADIDDDKTDTVAANALLQNYWREIKAEHPSIRVDFSGELDDINESLEGMGVLFIMGLGLIYLIMGTQFRSYWQPLMVFSAIPLAFIGVVFGLVLTSNPLSMMTLYGVVALSGISVNSAIVLISATNSRLESGMSPLHASIFAARRRVVPILITSITTIAGLASLALGIGGKSLLWGPVATAIVSGLIFSTVLVLIVIPLLCFASATLQQRRRIAAEQVDV